LDRRAIVYRARTLLRERGLEMGRANPDCPPYSFLQLVVFPTLGINCVFDVGASRGEFGQHLRDYGYRGRIVSFEPASENYEVLSARAKQDPLWITYRFALGDQAETRELNVTRGSFWPSFLPPSAYGLQEYYDEIEVVTREPVEVRTMTSVFEESTRGIAVPRVYLKLDTQGYDRQVLQGAEQFLDRVPVLQTELSFQQEYEGMTPAPEMIAFLEQRGYALSAIFKVFRDSQLVLSEADGIFVRPGV
jgi:FkbM family methyltransferase